MMQIFDNLNSELCNVVNFISKLRINKSFVDQDPVVQSIVSLTNSLSGQLVKCFYDFITKYTDIFC